MRFYTAAAVREADEKLIREGTPSRVLMRRAARGIAAHIEAMGRALGVSSPRILWAAGKGNNGGDAVAAACMMMEAGWNCEVWLACDPARLSGDPAWFLSRYRELGGVLRGGPAEEDWFADPGRMPLADIVVDGLLGTGAKGTPAGVTAAAIRWINALSRHALVVALDFPSGVDATTGDAPGEAVRADLTVCLGLPKTGLLNPAARERTGSVEFVDIGLPPPEDGAGPLHLNAGEEAREPGPRPRDAHKGLYGRVLVAGGSPGLTGAPGLAARGALASGTGLVEVIVPPGLGVLTAPSVPGAMVHEAALDAGLWKRAGACLEKAASVVIGPGMGTGPEARACVQMLLEAATVPVVLDADALNAFAGRSGDLRTFYPPLVLTPHPGEMGRLLGLSAAEVQADRLAAARRLAENTGATVVLKGEGTLIVSEHHEARLNLNGNPGLARGGAGDVLAGLIGGLIACGYSSFAAACLGVWLHGRAGDLAAWRHGPWGLRIEEVAAALPAAWRSAGCLR